ncbi:MAG TPA: tRNA lysidine(34) synthetase TilS [Pseudolysinimonas sp.]|nr:tRNA lysidine(34) synthetase TilS [Pseudolysinimonas sp.]
MPDSARPRLTPAVADVRRAVRAGLFPFSGTGETEVADVASGRGFRSTSTPSSPPVPENGKPLVLVALSGGPDSLALAAAVAFEAPRAGVSAGAVVVDHQLQDGSDVVAERAAEQARALGLDPVRVVRVTVADDGGPEASARAARYKALSSVAADLGAVAVLLGHTLDDQAETVLLGLARGSGSASLQGMAPVAGLYRRPLLGIRRSMTVQACADAGLEPWADPHNDDPAYTRVRVRKNVLPVLEAELGPGVADALARTAEQLREDSAALDAFAEEVVEDLAEHVEAGIALPAAALAANPPALRQRLIRLVAASEFGVSLSRAHTLEIARLVTDWHGQDGVDVPGAKVTRVGGMIEFRASTNGHGETGADGRG